MSHVSLRTFAAEFFNWQKHQAKQTHPKCSDDMTIASLHRHWQYQWRQSWFTGSCDTFQLGHFFNWDIYSWMRKKKITYFPVKGKRYCPACFPGIVAPYATCVLRPILATQGVSGSV